MSPASYSSRLLALAVAALLAVAGCDRGKPPAPAAAPAPSRSGAEEARKAAESYLEAGKPQEALVIARRLAATDPESAISQELLGRSLLALSMLAPAPEQPPLREEAADAYLKAAKADPGNAPLQHAAGVALDQAARLDDALACYQRAAAIEPNNPQFALYEGLALRRLNRVPEALTALERAYALDNSSALIAASLSEALVASGRTLRAVDVAAEARRLDPRDLGVRVTECKALRAAGRYVDAVERLMALSLSDLSQEAVAHELGTSLLAMGRFPAAAQAFDRSFNSDNRRWKSAVGAAGAWLAAGDRTKALARVEAAELVAPNEPEVKEIGARVRSAPSADGR